MAQRYGKLPSEILKGELKDFNLNLAIYYKAMLKENEEYQRAMKGYNVKVDDKELVASDFKLKRIVKEDGNK